MIGLAPFVVAEGVFTVLDWGRPAHYGDPFVGFSAVHPLFVLSDDGSRYEIARSRQAFFRPASFAARKPDDEFRIFCLGGSTVQGRPFAVETSLTTWLELSLQAAEPGRRWKVVNCGGVSYASYRLAPILEEVLRYEPDLVILYAGHNEFLEDRTYEHIKELPPVVARPCELVAQTRTFTLVRAGWMKLAGRPATDPPEGRPVLEGEVDAMLDYRGGLEEYHRDEKWRRDVVSHFRYNVERMVETARRAGVPLVLVNPVSNLRDYPPFKNQHRDGLAPQQLRKWEELVSRAGEARAKNVAQSAALLEKARTIDDQHAGLHFLLAGCYDAMGTTDRARESYVRAKELDVCPLRMLEPMHEILLDVARRSKTPLVDVRRLFEEASEAGIPGSYLLLDHVHPSITGHQLIAGALADELVREGIVHPAAGWKRRQDERFRAHRASLDDFYYAKGLERLEALRCWAMGKAGTPPAEARPP